MYNICSPCYPSFFLGNYLLCLGGSLQDLLSKHGEPSLVAQCRDQQQARPRQRAWGRRGSASSNGTLAHKYSWSTAVDRRLDAVRRQNFEYRCCGPYQTLSRFSVCFTHRTYVQQSLFPYPNFLIMTSIRK